MMERAVAGTGHIGLSVAVLLPQQREVVALDIQARKMDLLNARRSPIHDPQIERFLIEALLRLRALLESRRRMQAQSYCLAKDTEQLPADTSGYVTKPDAGERRFKLNM